MNYLLYAYIFGYFLNLFLTFRFNKHGMPKPFRKNEQETEPMSLKEALFISFFNPIILFVFGVGIALYKLNAWYKILDKKFQRKEPYKSRFQN